MILRTVPYHIYSIHNQSHYRSEYFSMIELKQRSSIEKKDSQVKNC